MSHSFFNRATMGQAQFIIYPWFTFFVILSGTRRRPHSATLKVAMSHATCEVCLPKAVETLIHGQPNVTDIVFFILWNISFLLALDSKGIINTLKGY